MTQKRRAEYFDLYENFILIQDEDGKVEFQELYHDENSDCYLPIGRGWSSPYSSFDEGLQKRP